MERINKEVIIYVWNIVLFGTGHGLADMLEIIEKYQASYQLAEYEDTDGFTKGITITWDRLNRRVLNSKRKELLIEHTIWK